MKYIIHCTLKMWFMCIIIVLFGFLKRKKGSWRPHFLTGNYRYCTVQYRQCDTVCMLWSPTRGGHDRICFVYKCILRMQSSYIWHLLLKSRLIFIKKKQKNKSTAHLQWSSNRSDLTVCGRLLNRRRGQSADCVMCWAGRWAAVSVCLLTVGCGLLRFLL